jgi:hypothetical protein
VAKDLAVSPAQYKFNRHVSSLRNPQANGFVLPGGQQMPGTIKKHACPGGCFAFHVHEMLDGSFAVFFDDMPISTGFWTREAADRAKVTFTQVAS